MENVVCSLYNRGIFILDTIGIDNLAKKITQPLFGKMKIIVEIVKDQIRAWLENAMNTELITVFERTPSMEIGFLVKTWEMGSMSKSILEIM